MPSFTLFDEDVVSVGAFGGQNQPLVGERQYLLIVSQSLRLLLAGYSRSAAPTDLVFLAV
jgi:hypothetical protein